MIFIEESVAGATTRLGPESSFIVAPNLVHGIVTLTNGSLIDTSTLCGDDFL